MRLGFFATALLAVTSQVNALSLNKLAEVADNNDPENYQFAERSIQPLLDFQDEFNVG